MHLTFVNSYGLEQAAISIISPSTQPNSKMRPSRQEDYYNEGGGTNVYGEDSGTESDYFVVDEASPLLVDLDPPGTQVSYMGGEKKRYPNKLLSFRIRKRKTQRLPLVIVLTAFGMAAMVVAGFVTMFQGTPVTNISDINDDASFNATGQPSTADVVNEDVNGIIVDEIATSTNGNRNLINPLTITE